MRNQFFFALYTSWALVWAFVAFTYSRATYQSWRAQEGRFRSIPREITGFVRWFFLETYQDVRHGFHEWDERIPERYSSGHLLRFFITMSAFVASLFGLIGSMIDRDGLSPTLLVLLPCAVLLSMCAGLGHLSVAWCWQPRRWRLLIFGVGAWFPLGYIIRGFFP